MNRWIWLSLIFACGCAHNSNQTWEDMKTAGRYMGRGFDALLGKEYESRMLSSDEEFLGPNDEEFLPLRDADLKNLLAAADGAIPQPRGIPGEKGVPSLKDFYAPSSILRSFFPTIHFETDDHVVRERSEVQSLLRLASFLKEHPNIYVVIEGNCDERASASYNMALGMRRANFVRSLLVKNGVDLNRIYTISNGKERPVAIGHSAEDWKQNRRGEFRIFEK
ncbi:MAG: OmpA family protein [Chlamydiia bacterium]|nr:OmpA family protein [Chlamydiia bacterium]